MLTEQQVEEMKEQITHNYKELRKYHIQKLLDYHGLTAGCVRTQKQHKLTIPAELIDYIKAYLTDCGYRVDLHHGNNKISGEPYTLITLFWGE